MESREIVPDLAKAREILEDWNCIHPDRRMPYEWIEELVIAYKLWKIWGRKRHQKANYYYQRYQEFAVKLPRGLVDRIRSDW